MRVCEKVEESRIFHVLECRIVFESFHRAKAFELCGINCGQFSGWSDTETGILSGYLTRIFYFLLAWGLVKDFPSRMVDEISFDTREQKRVGN